MKTYYIEIERQGWTLAVVKVEAETYEEAEYKALKALHMNDDISEASEESVKASIDSGDIDYVIDENGDEIDIEDETSEDEKETYILYMQDESGFENSYKYKDKDAAIKKAIEIWDDEEGGFCVVAVFDKDDNRIWYAEH